MTGQTRNWRWRLAASAADGTVLSTSEYPLLYNDQFFTDSKGDVTYANGKPFLVPTTRRPSPKWRNRRRRSTPRRTASR